MNAGEKIKEVLSWRGISQKKMAACLNIPYSTFNAYIRGHHQMTIKFAKGVADELGVSLFLLLNEDPLPADSLELTMDERELVAHYRLLTKEQREMISQNTNLLSKQNQKR